MFARLKQFARRTIIHRLKTRARENWYPILLPDYRIVDGGLSNCFGPPDPLPPELLAGLALCDGRRKLRDVASSSGVSCARLAAQEDAGTLVLWPPEPRRRTAIPPANLPTELSGFLPDEIIILSPHLDDAALSLGGLMLQQKAFRAKCTVVDIFSRVSWWRFDLSEDALPRIQATRDTEEGWVMRLAGAELIRWGLAEAPLRGYPLAEIFTTDRKLEAAATHEFIRSAVCKLARERHATNWYLPLAIGNHIDHRIARDAALDGLREAQTPLEKLHFYEDLPYAAQQAGVEDYSSFLAGVLPGCRLGESAVRVDQGKLRLLRAYGSQLTPSQIDLVFEYSRRVYRVLRGERTWHIEADAAERAKGQIPPSAPSSMSAAHG